MSAKRVGREGDGPGEYRTAINFCLNNDTLVVAHGGGYQASLFLLPSLEFIRKLHPKTWFPIEQLWEPEGTFLSNDLPWRQRGFLSKDRPGDQIEDGLFGRFTEDGGLIEVFGIDEFDSMKKYGSERELVRSTNWGSLVWLPSGNVVFVYSSRPLLLEYTPSGRLVAERELEMPWNDDSWPNPFWSDQFGKWMARPYIKSLEVTQSGFLISARGWLKRDNLMQMIVALYDWNGNLTEIIHLPKLTVPMSSEGFLYGVTEVNGEYWVTVNADPNIRKLILK